MSLTGNVSLLREEMKEDAFSKGCLDDIDAAVKRAVGLAAILQQAAQRRVVHLEKTDLNAVVESALAVPSLQGQNILPCRFKGGKSLPPVHADHFLLSLMIFELVTEASRAAPPPMPGASKEDSCAIEISSCPACEEGAETVGEAPRLVELIVEASGFRPWSTLVEGEHGSAWDARLSFEVAKTVMKCFQGRLEVAAIGAADDRLSLLFPAEDVLPSKALVN